MSDAIPPTSTAIVVLGMHRSGTSALTRALNLAGVDLGKHLMVAAGDNPTGFWEQKQIVDCHTELLQSLGSYFDDFIPLPQDWEKRAEVQPIRHRLLDILRGEFGDKPLWGFKDPRACRLLPLWHQIISDNGAAACFVLMLRDPSEIAASLAQRSGQSWNKSLLMTLDHLLEAERQTRGCRRAIVSYDQLLGDWRGTLSTIGQALKIEWPKPLDSVAEEFTRFLDGGLWHHHAPPAGDANAAVRDHGADERIARWTFAAHRILLSGGAFNELDALSAEVEAARQELVGWRPNWSIDEEFLRLLERNRSAGEEMESILAANRDAREVAASRARAAVAEKLSAEAEIRAMAAERRSAEAEARASEAERRAAGSERRVTEALDQAMNLQKLLHALEKSSAESGASKDAHAASLDARARAAEETISRMIASRSWNLTRPIRYLRGLFR